MLFHFHFTAKCGKSTKNRTDYCYGNSCLKNAYPNCNNGKAYAINPESIEKPICFSTAKIKNIKVAEVLCKELGFPVFAKSVKPIQVEPINRYLTNIHFLHYTSI